jgi:hypothetical protein
MAEKLTEFGLEQVCDYFTTRARRVQLGGVIVQTGDDINYYSEVKPMTLDYSASVTIATMTLANDVVFDVVIPAFAKAGAQIIIIHIFILDLNTVFLGQFNGVGSLPAASGRSVGDTAYAVIETSPNDITGSFYQVQSVSGSNQWVEVADDIDKFMKIDLENGADYSGNGEFTLTDIEITLS